LANTDVPVYVVFEDKSCGEVLLNHPKATSAPLYENGNDVGDEILLQSVHVGPPAPSDACQKLDVFLWRWIGALLDAVSRNTFNILELNVGDGRGQ
jgi:hypothetical protein